MEKSLVRLHNLQSTLAANALPAYRDKRLFNSSTVADIEVYNISQREFSLSGLKPAFDNMNIHQLY